MQTETQIQTITISAKYLRQIATLDAMTSSDAARPLLTGIHLKTENGTLTATATDSYQLAFMRRQVAGEINALVPGAYLVRISKELGKKYNGDVTITRDGCKITAELPTATLTDWVIDGTYPNCQSLISTAENAMNQDRNTAAGEATTALDINLLARVAKLYPYNEKRQRASGKIYVSDSTSAVIIEHKDVTVLQMPVRIA